MPSFFTASLSLLKSAGTGINLSTCNFSTSDFELGKSDFTTNLDVLILVAFLKLVFAV